MKVDIILEDGVTIKWPVVDSLEYKADEFCFIFKQKEIEYKYFDSEIYHLIIHN